MVLSGSRVTPQGETVVDRITWTPHDDSTVRQHWEMSSDEEQTWSTLFDGKCWERALTMSSFGTYQMSQILEWTELMPHLPGASCRTG